MWLINVMPAVDPFTDKVDNLDVRHDLQLSLIWSYDMDQLIDLCYCILSLLGCNGISQTFWSVVAKTCWLDCLSNPSFHSISCLTIHYSLHCLLFTIKWTPWKVQQKAKTLLEKWRLLYQYPLLIKSPSTERVTNAVSNFMSHSPTPTRRLIGHFLF